MHYHMRTLPFFSIIVLLIKDKDTYMYTATGGIIPEAAWEAGYKANTQA